MGSSARQQQWLVDDGAGNSYQLLLPAGKLAGVEIFLPHDLKLVERVGDQSLPLAARNVLIRKRQVDVLAYGKVVEQVVALEDDADILLGDFATLLALHVMHGIFAKPILAGPLIVEQSEHVEQRRLPGSGRSHDGDELTFLDVEVDAAQDPGLSGRGFVTAFDIF